METKNSIHSNITASIVSALVLFLSLSTILSGAASIIMSGIVSLLAIPFILIFCFSANIVLSKFKSNNIKITILSIATLSILLGLFGYTVANSIAYFEGTIIAFILSGLSAGIVVILNIKLTRP